MAPSLPPYDDCNHRRRDPLPRASRGGASISCVSRRPTENLPFARHCAAVHAPPRCARSCCEPPPVALTRHSPGCARRRRHLTLLPSATTRRASPFSHAAARRARCAARAARAALKRACLALPRAFARTSSPGHGSAPYLSLPRPLLCARARRRALATARRGAGQSASGRVLPREGVWVRLGNRCSARVCWAFHLPPRPAQAMAPRRAVAPLRLLLFALLAAATAAHWKRQTQEDDHPPPSFDPPPPAMCPTHPMPVPPMKPCNVPNSTWPWSQAAYGAPPLSKRCPKCRGAGASCATDADCCSAACVIPTGYNTMGAFLAAPKTKRRILSTFSKAILSASCSRALSPGTCADPKPYAPCHVGSAGGGANAPPYPCVVSPFDAKTTADPATYTPPPRYCLNQSASFCHPPDPAFCSVPFVAGVGTAPSTTSQQSTARGGGGRCTNHNIFRFCAHSLNNG